MTIVPIVIGIYFPKPSMFYQAKYSRLILLTPQVHSYKRQSSFSNTSENLPKDWNKSLTVYNLTEVLPLENQMRTSVQQRELKLHSCYWQWWSNEKMKVSLCSPKILKVMNSVGLLKDSFREVCNPKFTLKLKNSVSTTLLR